MADDDAGFLDHLGRAVVWISLVIFLVGLAAAGYFAWRLSRDTAETFADPVAQFKYGSTGGDRNYLQGDVPFDYAALKAAYRNKGGKVAWMVNNGYDRDLALKAVESGYADLVAFGKLFIANPDLVERLREDSPLNAPDQATFYGGGEKGYTDYPTLATA